jgi:branched-chain amino acid aminotransferase
MNDQRLVYINGELIPEAQATISIFDVGFMYGVTLYESLRSFKHKWFLPDAHWKRLHRSLNYAGMGELLSKQQYDDVLEQTLQANIHLTDEEDDAWVNIQVTPGQTFPMPLAAHGQGEPTIMCYTAALPHVDYARYYTDGKHVRTSMFRSPPSQSYDQRMKNRSRFPHFLAKRDVARIDPDAFALMLDTNGYIAEGTGANIFFVLDGKLYTPRSNNILLGISRQYIMTLAGELGIEVVEAELTLYEAYNAEEAFWSTSSYCLLPISLIDGRALGASYPGAIAGRLLKLWSDKVGVDIVGQSQKFGEQ